mgnify:CR=1 FL=1
MVISRTWCKNTSDTETSGNELNTYQSMNPAPQTILVGHFFLIMKSKPLDMVAKIRKGLLALKSPEFSQILSMTKLALHAWRISASFILCNQ